MPLKFITKKSYLENVNGLQNFEEFNINYDSNRDKNKQIQASFNSNGKQYQIEDSLQKFMNTMPNGQNSIFDLLKNELRESKKNNTTNLSSLNKIMKFKTGNTRKSSKGKYRVNRGITSKLFDYDQEIVPDNNNKIYITKKSQHGKKLEHGKKFEHGKKHTRRLKLKIQ